MKTKFQIFYVISLKRNRVLESITKCYNIGDIDCGIDLVLMSVKLGKKINKYVWWETQENFPIFSHRLIGSSDCHFHRFERL